MKRVYPAFGGMLDFSTDRFALGKNRHNRALSAAEIMALYNATR